MGLLYGTRLGLFGLATITAIIAFGLSIHTNIAGNNFDSSVKGAFDAFFKGNLTFAHLGIAAGVFTLIVVPFLLLADRPKLSPVRPLISIEVPIVSLLWILWISAGVSTASFASANQDFHIYGARTCDDFQDEFPDAKIVCNDSKPTIIFDIATGVILLVYTATLVVVASKKSYGGRSIWSMTVKESEA